MAIPRVPTIYLGEKSDRLRRSVERLDRLDTAYQVDELEQIAMYAQAILRECDKWIRIQDDASTNMPTRSV